MSDFQPSILFVNQHYWPDFASTGQHLTDLAEHLAASGFNVSVLCSRGRYLAGELEVPLLETRNGVTIHRVRASSFGRDRHLGRILDYGTFYLQTIARLFRRNRYQYIVFLTTPPLLSFMGGILRRITGQKYGIWSMDLHPDAEEEVGMIKTGSPTARLLHALNDFGYRNAEFIVDLGAFMKQRLVQRDVRPERLHTIPVWSHKDEVEPVDRESNPLIDELGLSDKFVIMYSGNAGLVHRFDETLAAMKRLRDDPDVFFLFVGAGPRRKEIEAFAGENDIQNFRYLDYFDRSQLKLSLSIADVHLLTLRDSAAGIAVPGKLYGIMASGRPVLMVGPEASEPGETIQEEDCGYVIDPTRDDQSVDSIVDHIQTLKNDADEARRLGENGRRAFLASYEKDVACRQWESLLNDVTNRSNRRPAVSLESVNPVSEYSGTGT